MYETFYRLASEPFRLSPDHRFCYSHRSYARAKAYMQYAFNRAEGFVMVTGRPGTGKTTLISDLTESLPRSQVSVGTLVTTQLEAEDLLQMVAHAFGLNTTVTNKAAILQYFTTMLRREREKGRRALLIIDEAQNLTSAALEELRLLTNLQQNGQPLLQIFLVGQEELRDLIHVPQMEQVFQRIVAACHIEALTQEETRDYVYHRLGQAGWNNDPQLSESLFPIIHRFSEGIPRRINLICGRLLLHGAVERMHKIGVADARLVVAELHSERLTSLSPQADSIFDAPDRFPEVPVDTARFRRPEPVRQGGEDHEAVAGDGAPEADGGKGPAEAPVPGGEGGNLSPAENDAESPPVAEEVAGPDRSRLSRRARREARQRRRQRQMELLEQAAPLAGEEQGGADWFWWLLLLVVLLAGAGAFWLLGYPG